MSQAIARISTISMLDAIAPKRERFNVHNNPNPAPAKSATMRAIDRAVANLPPDAHRHSERGPASGRD